MPEIKIEIVADDENIFGFYLIEIDGFLDGKTGIVVKGLGLHEKDVASAVGFSDNRVEFLGFLPGETVYFEIKIKGEKAEIMTSEIVLIARISEADDKFHRDIIA